MHIGILHPVSVQQLPSRAAESNTAVTSCWCPPEYTRGPSLSTKYPISSAQVTRVLQQQEQQEQKQMLRKPRSGNSTAKQLLVQHLKTIRKD